MLPAEPPGKPTIRSVEVGAQHVEIYWKAPIDNGGSPVLGYFVQATKKVGSLIGTNCTGTDNNITSLCKIDELDSGTDYVVSVLARSVVGYGEAATEEITTKSKSIGKFD